MNMISRVFHTVLLMATTTVYVIPGLQAATGPSIDKPGKMGGYDPWHQRTGRHSVVVPKKYVTSESARGRFGLVNNRKASTLVVSSIDYPGVIRAANDLREDIRRVTRTEPVIVHDTVPMSSEVVLIGTIGKSPLIDNLVRNGKLDVSGIAGCWETFLLQVVEKPIPGVRQALIIAGSDQRGTIFGIYDLSGQIGVSPWYWWDDVPPRFRSALYITPGRHTKGEPAVKYRGIFINDENPALGTWAPHHFGQAPNPDFPYGFNHQFYAKVFETLLRLKANLLWPAVWSRAFAEDDSLNHATAKEYGIVMGTSHEAPMMRGIEEWNRHAVPTVRDENGNIITPGKDPFGGTGEWRYSKNAKSIETYWTKGIQRMVQEDFEGIVTLGMRGPGDISLPVGDGIELIQNVIASQRRILSETTKRDVTSIPQVWTLYKEIQGYWDEGIRVPDDVTVIWCDDNWGNLRKLPDRRVPERNGGYGVYYHFDYVGGGRNYKWIDTNLLPNVWEQMHLCYRYGVDRLWVVNVGDMKNEELPMHFFLDYAWNPELIPVERIPEWETAWAEQQFGPEHAVEIAEALSSYASLQSDRKPELLNRKITLDPDITFEESPDDAVIYTDASPFSLTDYREMERVVTQWRQLAADAERIRWMLPERLQDAYYQLVYYQVKASALMYELRYAEFNNLLYLNQGRAATNDMATCAQAKFNATKAMAYYYNNILAGGKWQGFQTQPYLGYGGNYPNSSWQQPERDNVAIDDFIWPLLQQYTVPSGSGMGVAIDGSDRVWPDEKAMQVLPVFSPYQTQPAQYIEVFNRGSDAFEYTITPSVPWMSVVPDHGKVTKQVRAIVGVDWMRAPQGTTKIPLTVKGPGNTSMVVQAIVNNPSIDLRKFNGFIESNGYVSMEAEHFSRAVKAGSIFWKHIPGIGRTGGGMTPFPVDALRQKPEGKSPRLEYTMYLFSRGEIEVWIYCSPRNNVLHEDGLKYAVSIDDGTPNVVNITTALNGIPMNRSWERNTSDNVNRTSTHFTIDRPGEHTLKFWMVDPTVIIQKIIVNTGGLKESYLGPPESYRMIRHNRDKRRHLGWQQ